MDENITQNEQNGTNENEPVVKLDIRTSLKHLVHRGLKQLAGVCDGAREKDDQGFAASDVSDGHRLAHQAELTDIQMGTAVRLCRKYRGQLGEEFSAQLESLVTLIELSGEPVITPYDTPQETTITIVTPLPPPTPVPQPPPPPPPPPGLVLTDEQNCAVDTITDWMREGDDTNPEFKLGGYAGTGKTTIIKTVREELRKDYNTVVAAFTGKAVNVLQRKGISAQTLHSLMYDVDPKPDGTVEFHKKSVLKESPDLIIVDEASMISVELYMDLLSFNLKYLFVGDPGQLEPIGDNPNLMAKPDLVLSKIHRQAERSPIVQLATSVRNGGQITDFKDGGEDVVIKNKTIRFSEYELVDQILCARNQTRTNLNANIRRAKGYTQPLVEGEKIIVLRNNLSYAVFNGMILFVDTIAPGRHSNPKAPYWEVTTHDEIDRKYRLNLWQDPFTSPIFDKLFGKSPVVPKVDRIPLVYATYGYCITCHKSQGSEWDHVLVMDEWMPPTVWDMKRWRYTAITRAAKKLTYCM